MGHLFLPKENLTLFLPLLGLFLILNPSYIENASSPSMLYNYKEKLWFKSDLNVWVNAFILNIYSGGKKRNLNL